MRRMAIGSVLLFFTLRFIVIFSEWNLVFVRMASGSVLLVGAGLTSSLTASLLAESLPGLSVLEEIFQL